MLTWVIICHPTAYKGDKENPAGDRTYKYSQLLPNIVQFTIVNSETCQGGGVATRLTADQLHSGSNPDLGFLQGFLHNPEEEKRCMSISSTQV
jgi:hypothetical protein